jgi:nitrite reductase/ring-hydroxylating ferredoxin subunit
MIKLLKYFAPVVLFVFFVPSSSCKKETTCNGVPVVSVYFQVTLATNPQLGPPGNNELFSGGYQNSGVLVYHYSGTQYYAYDCTCPYDGESNSKAVVSASSVSSLYAVCPVCGSSFLLSTGSPNKGPSTCPLKAYSGTYYDAGSNTVIVQN